MGIVGAKGLTRAGAAFKSGDRHTLVNIQRKRHAWILVFQIQLFGHSVLPIFGVARVCVYSYAHGRLESRTSGDKQSAFQGTAG